MTHNAEMDAGRYCPGMDTCDRCGHHHWPSMRGRQALLTPCPNCTTRVTPPEVGAS